MIKGRISGFRTSQVGRHFGVGGPEITETCEGGPRLLSFAQSRSDRKLTTLSPFIRAPPDVVLEGA